MIETAKEILGALLRSRKFVGLLVGLLTVVGVKVGLDEETAQGLADRIAVMVTGYLIGQGIADHGKEKAKEEAKAIKVTSPSEGS